jgi:hypothetical protein
MRNLSQDGRSPGRDWNLGPPEYEAGVLTQKAIVDIFTAMRTCSKMRFNYGHSIRMSLPSDMR